MTESQTQTDLKPLFASLDRCMVADRHRLRRRLGQAKQRLQRGQPADRILGQVERQLRESIERRQRRAAGVPELRYPEDLPVVERRDDIRRAIEQHPVVVVCGATGSGKTTQLPKICLEAGRGVDGIIGHTQPRRIAARSVAARIAEELGTSIGGTVGYKIRFADQAGPDPLVKVMTDGILLNELTGDRDLNAYDTLIIDEAHERSLNIDFLLGCLKQLLARRPDLKLIITSATIDPQRFSAHFNEAPIIEVSGRAHPVDVRYRPLATPDDDEDDRDQTQGIVDAVHELSRDQQGDILVFLPGERDIRDAAEALAGAFPHVDVLPLYARLPSHKQDRIFHPTGGRRRIVLATNVAETSLTVPGIRHVIDTGVARISRYSPRSKVQRLPIEPISQASADQRKGRCGRVAPGVCIRLYEQPDFEQREPFTEPEIQRTNLAGVILQMATLKLGTVEQFPFIDPPSGRAISDGYETLHELGAIDEAGRLTKIGRELARLPVDPRIGRMILAADREGALREVLAIAAVLSVQDPRVRPFDQQGAADEAHEPFFAECDSDFIGLLNIWRFYREQKRNLSRNQLRRACKQNFLSYARMREWEEVEKQLHRIAVEQGLRRNERPADADQIHRALLTGLLSNLGHKGDGHEYAGGRGRKFAIFPGSTLFSRKPKWVMAAELVETSKLYARTVAKIQPQWIERVAEHLIQRSYSDAHWDAERANVMAFERVSLFGLTIVPRRRVPYGKVDPVEARNLFIHHALVEGEFSTKAPFFEHNRRLVDQIERIEAKRRKRDVLLSPQVRFDFYDARVGREVTNGASFEQWRKQAEREKPDLLFMRREDLMAHDAAEVTAELYPDELPVGGSTLQLDYHAEPGHEDDGVTVTVPLAMLNQVSAERLDYLVPGLLKEKVVALIKTLPKAIRKNFVPVPEFAKRLLPMLNDDGGRPLVQELAERMSGFSGIEVPADAFDPSQLPEHLRMKVRVVDEAGRPLAADRELEPLREQLGDQARSLLKRGAGEAASPWHRDGLNDWDFDELPERVEVDSAGVTLRGHPALVDQGAAVGLRVMDTPEAAAAATRAGLRRLFALQVGAELAYLEYETPQLDQLALDFATLGSRKQLVRDLLDAAVDRCFLADDPRIRDRQAFEQRLASHRDRLDAAFAEVVQLAGSILRSYQPVRAELDGAPGAWRDAVADMSDQLAHLFAERFLVETPWPWLCQYPRYLAAMRRRIEKIENGELQKDKARIAEYAELWRQCQARRKAERDRNRVDPQLEHYRWMLEEYRVSIHAQDLGTFVPVSAKRLAKQWKKVGRV